MTKVEHIKTHQVFRKGHGDFYSNHDVLVTEAKLVLVDVTESDVFSGFKYYVNLPNQYTSVKPILISETEKIEVGNCWDTVDKRIKYVEKIDGDRCCDAINTLVTKYMAKIVALPEHFSLSQMQDIVDGKLKDRDKVLIECEIVKNYYEKNKGVCGITMCYFNDEKVKDKCLGWCCDQPVVKLNPHITIYPVEEKVYTRDEVKNILVQFATDCDANDDLICYEGHNEKGERQYNDLKEWFEQNVK